MTNENFLQELVQRERQAELETERVESGWNRLTTEIAAGHASELASASGKTIRLTQSWPARITVVAVVLGGITAGSIAGWHSMRQNVAPVPKWVTTATSRDPVSAHSATIPSEGVVTTGISSAIAPDPAGSVAARVRKGSTPGVGRSAGNPGDTFDQELSLIKAAKAALDSGADAHALSLLDEHRQRFARGLFAGEREALRVLAHCSKQPTTEGRRLAEGFLRAYPNSPMVDRIAKSCAMQIREFHQ
jgi:hypothetical protein